MFFSLAFNVNKNVIKVYDNKNIEFFCQDLINIVLKSGQYISQFKKYYLVLKMAIASTKNNLLFIAFLDPHLMINIDKIKLGKMLSLA